MAKITNLTRETLNFITGIRDGAAATESLKGGETKEIAVDLHDAQLRGRILSGVIAIEGDVAPSAKPHAAAPSAERRTAPTLGGTASVRE